MKNVIILMSIFALLVAGCGAATTECPKAVDAQSGPTVEEAEQFIAEMEPQLLDKLVHAERAAWVQLNFITFDTELNAARAHGELMAFIAQKAEEARRFDGLELPETSRRKLDKFLRLLPLLAPVDAAERDELAALAASLPSRYGKAQYCKKDEKGQETCRTLGDLTKVITTSRDEAALRDAWLGWRQQARDLKGDYTRFAALANKGAQHFGFEDVGVFWRTKYDMPPEDFSVEVQRLWAQIQPTYEQLHCHVRAKLSETYGTDIVSSEAPIPAHLLGNMWAQDWSAIFDLVAPEKDDGLDLTGLLVDNNYDVEKMFKTGETFFVSLGLDPLPSTFWERSLFTKPRDREVVCHASAWDVDWKDDLRIKMCTEVNADDFITIHHELGHNYYQRAYKELSPVFTESAHDGFHEALGDLIALSITPGYLQEIGLINTAPKPSLNPLMRRALEKIAFFPWALLVDQWRYDVFSGEVSPEQYNARWWELRKSYQGVASPVERTSSDFDPGAKFHIPANVPYTRYFLSFVLQFQIHRGLCRAIGHTGPLNECSIYNNKKAGGLINEMMELGASRPWPEALKIVTGEEQMDASALIEYFEPLTAWLKEQNKDRTCGWN